jgi:hypothetical protein
MTRFYQIKRWIKRDTRWVRDSTNTATTENSVSNTQMVQITSSSITCIVEQVHNMALSPTSPSQEEQRRVVGEQLFSPVTQLQPFTSSRNTSSSPSNTPIHQTSPGKALENMIRSLPPLPRKREVPEVHGVNLLHGSQPKLLWGLGSDVDSYPSLDTLDESGKELDPFTVLTEIINEATEVEAGKNNVTQAPCTIMNSHLSAVFSQHRASGSFRDLVPRLQNLSPLRAPVVWLGTMIGSSEESVVKLLHVPSWDPNHTRFTTQRELSRRAAGRRMHSLATELCIGRLASLHSTQETHILPFKHILFETFMCDSVKVERVWVTMPRACADAEGFLTTTILSNWFPDFSPSNPDLTWNHAAANRLIADLPSLTNNPSVSSLVQNLACQFSPTMAVYAAMGVPVQPTKSKDVRNLSRVIFKVWVDMMRGVAWLHERGIAHRDLKPVNVLVHPQEDGTFYASICDFGESVMLSKPVVGPWLGTNGTSAYRPYEWSHYPTHLAPLTEMPAVALSLIRMIGQVYLKPRTDMGIRMDKLRVEQEYQYSENLCSLSTYWVTRIRSDCVRRVPANEQAFFIFHRHFSSVLSLSESVWLQLWNVLVEACDYVPAQRPTSKWMLERVLYLLEDLDVDNATWRYKVESTSMDSLTTADTQVSRKMWNLFRR